VLLTREIEGRREKMETNKSCSREQIDKYKNGGLKAIVEQLQSCDYECIGGPLANNVAFIALTELAEETNRTQ
jgi:hypothetical protein